MLYLSLSLLNPFRPQDIESIRSFARKVSENWALELCFYNSRGYLLITDLSIRTRGDHIGLSLSLGIMRYKISFDLYNVNHAQDVL